uniref:Multidrug-efflux transporter n=1 Tax=uncultured Muribaculaceae bacterium TaxID=2301481 RepID=A0A6G8F3T2_9BACT|nr:MATE family efflux transporter [uncultured Muribaculaceae bacterium]
MLVTQLGIILVSFADTMMVGAYGLNELAASAFVNSLFLIVIVMLLGFAGGVTPLIGALYGKGNHTEGGIMLRASLQVNTIMAISFMVIMSGLYFFLDCFGQDPEILPIARRYYLIILFTLIPMAIFNCFQQTANGTTDTATPMWIILCADTINIIGNYLLIFGKFGCPELGLAGAGISTLVARTFAAITIVAVFAFRKRYKPYWEPLKTSHAGKERRLKVWNTSYPLMIQSGVECGLWSAGAVVSGWFGKVQLGAYQVVNTISQLGFMTYMSFGWAVSIRVANFTGLKDYRSIRKSTYAGLHLILVLCVIASLGFYFFADQLVTLFTSEQAVVAAALPLILPLILYQFCDATQLTYVNALRGTSEVRPLLWISIVGYLVVGIPLLYFMAVTLGLQTVGVYYSFSGALTVTALLLIFVYRRVLKAKECGK